MNIPEVRPENQDVGFRMPANCLTWALEYAFGLGQEHASIGAETAARMVVQSMAGRNMIRVVDSHWVGLTEYTAETPYPEG